MVLGRRPHCCTCEAAGHMFKECYDKNPAPTTQQRTAQQPTAVKEAMGQVLNDVSEWQQVTKKGLKVTLYYSPAGCLTGAKTRALSRSLHSSDNNRRRQQLEHLQKQLYEQKREQEQLHQLLDIGMKVGVMTPHRSGDRNLIDLIGEFGLIAEDVDVGS